MLILNYLESFFSLENFSLVNASPILNDLYKHTLSVLNRRKARWPQQKTAQSAVGSQKSGNWKIVIEGDFETV